MRRHLTRFGVVTVTVALLAGAANSLAAQRGSAVVEVFKTPTCGCCHLWVKHLEQNGFTTKVTDMDDLGALKRKNGVPARASSCHTAIVNGYVLEGHVPAAEIKKLLIQRPAIAGLAVPGMPVGSPGMEVGSTVQPYNVLAFDKAGETRIFASYGRR